MRVISILSALVAVGIISGASLNALADTADGAPIKQPAPPAGQQDVQQTAHMHGRPKLALSLGGGGGRGGAHIGALIALEQAGIKPDFVTGSSIGALIGSLYCAGVPVSRIQQMALDGELRKALLPSGLKWQAVKTMPVYALKRMVGMHPPIGLYNGKALTAFIERNLPAGKQRIEDLPIPFAAIATNMTNTRPIWVSKGRVAEAVRASAAIPYIYQPLKDNGRVLIDGGVRENLPTQAAKASDAPVVVAIKLNSSLDEQSPEKYQNFIDFSDRLMSILMSEIESKAIAQGDITIEPTITNTNTYSFSPHDLQKAIVAGYQATVEKIPEIKRKLQQTQGSTPTAASLSNPD